ncbi:MAG TPA: hypothetical protein VEU62_24525 [Bryobacterales bacterium]|nr:hypothetical protein [Bryobacterales bacterium]
MLLALLLTVSLADWVPARWIDRNPQSLDLLQQTPINCLLLERDQWSVALAERAASLGVVTLGVVRTGGDPLQAARDAVRNKLQGVVLEGDFSASVADRIKDSLAASKVTVVEMLPRRSMRLSNAKEAASEIAATYQGVWPGIQVQDSGATRAGPTGSPWINTNTGFLLFARAATSAPVWIGNLPPPKTVLPAEAYLHAICDAAALGARWVLSLDEDFRTRLLRRDEKALGDWKRIALYLQYFETHKEWRALPEHGRLAVLQDADSGALLSGSILDMIASKRTPVRVVPRARLSEDALRGSTMVLNLEADLLTPPQKQTLGRFSSAGNTLLTSPPEFKPPVLHGDQITVDEKDVGRIDDLYQGINSAIWHANFGLRLFNVASTLSNVLSEPGGNRLVLQLVNYSGYPVENITVRYPGDLRSAKMLTPEGPAREVEVYRTKEDTEIEINKLSVLATLILEQEAQTK